MHGTVLSRLFLCRALDSPVLRCLSSSALPCSSFGTCVTSGRLFLRHHAQKSHQHLISRHPVFPLNSLCTSAINTQKNDGGTTSWGVSSSGSTEKNGRNLQGPDGETASEAVREVDDRAFPHFKRQETVVTYGTPENPFPDPHSLIPKNIPQIGEETLPHPIWTPEQLENVRVAHKKPSGVVDWLAYLSVQTCRFGFDLMSGYTFGTLNEKNWLRSAYNG